MRPSRRSEGGAMFLEIAEIEVRAGEENAFEEGVRTAVPLFLRARGCHGVDLQRTVEAPSRYKLIVTWETVDDHMVHFRNSADFQEWRRLRSEEHTSELQSLMRISYAVFCLNHK